jgi:hypothetical protein
VDSLIVKDQTDDQIDYYSLLVGENAKFKNEKELAKGKYIADNYIGTLESQMDQLRAELDKERNTNMAKAKLEDLLDQYQKRQQEPPAKEPIQDKSPTIDPKQIESLIDNRMQERETSRKQQDNQDFVKKQLTEQYGTDYSRYIANAMSELDMSEDMLNQMARTNPKALLKMLGVGEQSRDPFRNTLRNTQVPFTPRPAEQKTWSYWQKMKEENPKKYHSRETNVEMHRAALELGDAFEDGDFNRFRKDFRISY